MVGLILSEMSCHERRHFIKKVIGPFIRKNWSWLWFIKVRAPAIMVMCHGYVCYASLSERVYSLRPYAGVLIKNAFLDCDSCSNYMKDS